MSPMMVIDVGITAPAPRPWSARNAIRAGILQEIPHKIDAMTKSPIPTSMIGLRPMRSVNLAKIGIDTACASRKIENNHGNWANPPRSLTIEGTAVARIVASIAIRPTLNMTESRIGPRSDRRPTDAREMVCSVGWAMFSATQDPARAFPRRCFVSLAGHWYVSALVIANDPNLGVATAVFALVIGNVPIRGG